MSLWDKLPVDVVEHIYGYDTTYKEKMNESLKFIEHACPTCCCDGSKKTRYRHYGDFEYSLFWNWEWRRRNACPKHNPEDFDKNGNQTEYRWRDTDYYHGTNNIFTIIYNMGDMVNYNPINDIVVHYEINSTYFQTNRCRGYINYNIIMRTLWMFCTRNKNIYHSPIKTYSRKKLSGARFMDMAHSQRPITA